VSDMPLKCVEQREDFSVSMKLETYPNRDSLVFQDRFGMKDCKTFIRGTIRYSGFSGIISAFHDIGLTSDELVCECCTDLTCFLKCRLNKKPEI
jgi:saccharopine dehydrogenase-like NADP-dependent oxidoreductase